MYFREGSFNFKKGCDAYDCSKLVTYPPGAVKSLQPFACATGVGSRVKKREIKRGINP